jgi:sarcosine oxidase
MNHSSPDQSFLHESRTYEVIVIGLGAMGSAAAYHLAEKGICVLGLDRFQPPHAFGSSHGLTRIIREAYFEHPSYVPLVQRAYELWADLEMKSGRKLLLQTGGLMIGSPNGALVSGALASAKEHKLKHEILSAEELRGRFPVFQIPENSVGVWEPRAGVLFPEQIVQTHLEMAARNGASLRFNEAVLRWEVARDGVRVVTAAATYRARRLLLSAGSWLSTLLNPSPTQAPLLLPLAVERQVLYWFAPVSQAEQFQANHCPIYIWEYETGRFFYGFPDLGDGVKVAMHHQGEYLDPDQVRREVDAEEIRQMRSVVERFLPSAAGPLRSTAVCIYTNTPDEHFVFDWHPEFPQVLVASPCSGHGFKFSSVIGELAADLLTGKQVPFDLSRFDARRFNDGRA